MTHGTPSPIQHDPPRPPTTHGTDFPQKSAAHDPWNRFGTARTPLLSHATLPAPPFRPSDIRVFQTPTGSCPHNATAELLVNDPPPAPVIRSCPIPEPRRGKCFVLSFGIAYNFVIDRHFLDKYNCTVWSFDPR